MSDRDWHRCNEALVMRVELNLDSSVVEQWKRELKKENEGKVGSRTTARVVHQAPGLRPPPLPPAPQADGGLR